MANEEQTKPFIISRTLNAPRRVVWDAWTKAEHLSKWFGPKGVSIGTFKLDFRPGGTFHYSMINPDGSEMWGKWTFREITPIERLVLTNSFSDPEGGITRHPLAPMWPKETLSSTTFRDLGKQTELTIEWEPINASSEEVAFFDSGREGMTQGWKGTFEQLEEYLGTL